MGLKELWKRMLPVTPDLPSHVPGVKQGNSTGNYEKQAGHLSDGRSTARRSTGVHDQSHNPIRPDMPNISPP